MAEFFRPPENREGEIFQRYAIGFDGHGSQFPGMGKEYLEAHPEAKRYFTLASDVLGYDLEKVCINGSKEQLNKTEFAQPAIVVYNLIAHNAFVEAFPEQASIKPSAFAYQSLGGLNAMHRSGMLGDPEGDEAIKQLVGIAAIRGKLMQEESEKVDGGMWLVSGARKGDKISSKTKRVFPKVINRFRRNGVVPAIERNEIQTVISGRVEDFDRVNLVIGKRMKSRFNIVSIKLPGASGPFHSPYMEEAARRFEEVLKSVNLFDPEIPIQSNSSPVRFLTSKEEVIEELVNGITGKVNGIEMADHFHDEDLPTYEVGEKMLIGDSLGFDERFEEPKKIPIRKIAAVSGSIAATAITTIAAAYLINRRRRGGDKDKQA